jgi:hypothetical protein
LTGVPEWSKLFLLTDCWSNSYWNGGLPKKQQE